MLLPPNAAACAENGRRKKLNTAALSCANIAEEKIIVIKNKNNLFFTICIFLCKFSVGCRHAKNLYLLILYAKIV
jgi:hypothetical protein